MSSVAATINTQFFFQVFSATALRVVVPPHPNPAANMVEVVLAHNSRPIFYGPPACFLYNCECDISSYNVARKYFMKNVCLATKQPLLLVFTPILVLELPCETLNSIVFKRIHLNDYFQRSAIHQSTVLSKD